MDKQNSNFFLHKKLCVYFFDAKKKIILSQKKSNFLGLKVIIYSSENDFSMKEIMMKYMYKIILLT